MLTEIGKVVKRGVVQEMALQVVVNREVKRSAAGIIDLMNKGLNDRG